MGGESFRAGTGSDAARYTPYTVILPFKTALAWIALAVFIIGVFWGPLQPWTRTFLTIWFLRCLKPPKGFALVFLAHVIVMAAARQAQDVHFSLIWLGAAALLTTLPFWVDRLVSERSQALTATIVLPLTALAADQILRLVCPTAAAVAALGQHQGRNPVFAFLGQAIGPTALRFLIFWFGSALNWASETSGMASRVRAGVCYSLLAVAVLVLGGAIAGIWVPPVTLAEPASPFLLGVSAALSLLLLFALWNQSANDEPGWDAEAVSRLLQSPKTRLAFSVAGSCRNGELVTDAGERYPIVDGIPRFAKGSDITGMNARLDKLYELLGGFYDEATRVEAMLKNGQENAIRLGWMQCVDVQAGQLVLETSVGSSGNLKSLPRDAEYVGLDLSGEMLRRGRYSCRRWGVRVRLVQGNAEELPFADGVFDVVYHVGAINFFTNPSAAIDEMIRVAKPGARLMIADEMEKDEQNRILALVPPEMEDVYTQLVSNGDAYVITMRKPAQAGMVRWGT